MTTYNIEHSSLYGDYRINKMIDGQWINSFDNNWSLVKAKMLLTDIGRLGEDIALFGELAGE